MKFNCWFSASDFIEAVETPYFLTLDADVAFAENYFEQLEKLSPADLYILPAVLISKRWSFLILSKQFCYYIFFTFATIFICKYIFICPLLRIFINPTCADYIYK